MSEVFITALSEAILVTVTQSGEEMAKQYALEALGYKEEAELAEIATAADRVATGLDAAATAADRVATGLDAVATSEDATTATQQAALASTARSEAEAAKLAAQNSEQNAAASELAAETAADSINAVLIQNLGDISGTVDIDLNIGTLIKATLTGSVTLSFTGLPNLTSEKGFTLRFSGIQMIVFPVGTLFASGEAPTPAGTLYDIPCSINSSGVVIVYGSINAIEI